MNAQSKIFSTLIAVTMVVFAAPALAANSNLLSLPQPVNDGNVNYITGGIGDAERQDLEAQAKNFNLLITDANKKGQYVVDNNFTITRKNGRDVVNIDNAGPLLYAKLPPGQYKITAMNGNQREVENIKISANREDHLHLIWR